MGSCSLRDFISHCTTGEKDEFCSAAGLARDVGHTENGGLQAAVPCQVPVTSPMSVSLPPVQKTHNPHGGKHHLLL